MPHNPTISKSIWPFSPQSIPGLALWLDAADESTITLSESSVTQWKDKSDNGFVATPLDGAITKTTLNGKTALDFGGNRMIIPDFTWNMSFTSIIVWKAYWGSQMIGLCESTSNYGWYDYISTGNWGLIMLNYNGTSSSDPNYIRGPTDAYPGNPAPVVDANQWFIFSIGYTAGTTTITNYAVNGSVHTANAVSAQTGSNTGVYFINGLSNGAYDYSQVAEIIHYNTSLSSSQRHQVEAYLAWKWNLGSLPTVHPYYGRPVFNRVFQPVDISGCQLWLDAADQSSMTFSSGTTVDVWNDKSGNGRNATILSGYTGATFSSTSNALYFPNSTTAYETSYSANPTNETMFVVFNNPSPSYNNNMVIGGPQGARALSGGYSGTTGEGACSYLYNEVTWGGIASMPASTYTSESTVIITGQVIDSYSSRISQNGGAVYSNSGTAFNGFNVNTYIGTDSGFSPPLFYYVGYIMEVIFYDSVLTTSQCQQVEAYLAWKWNIKSSLPNTHPGYRLPAFSGIFIPNSLPGCQLWLDAADQSAMTFSSGTTVSLWKDKSGNGNDGTPNTDVTWDVNGFGSGRPTMTFTNSQWFLGNISITGNQFTAFCVFNMNSESTTYARVLALGANGQNDYNDNAYMCIVRLGDDVFSNYRNGGYSAINIALNTNELTTSWIDGTTSYISQYGGTPATIGSSGNFGVSSYAIGNNTNAEDGSSPFYGFISEIIVYNTAMSTSQRQQVEGYLAWKWGLQSSLPETHAYKKFKP